MIIFNDLFTGKTVLSDSYKMKLIDDFVYVVEAKYVTKKGDEFGDDLFGGNPSAEEAAEDLESGQSVSGFDVILNHDDIEEYNEDPNYKKFIKNVMSKIIKTAAKKMDEEKGAEFKKKCSDFFKTGYGNPVKFKNFQIFFSKENIDIETGDLLACPIFVDADDTGLSATMYYFKHLLVEEKM